jgi:hypothetical protein
MKWYNLGENNALHYRFALIANQTGFNAVHAMKSSLEHQKALITGMVTGKKIFIRNPLILS